MTKLKAREALRAEIVKRNGQVPEGRVLKDSSATFGWFVRNRYFPIRKGDWRPQTAVTKMDQIETDLVSKFGDYPMESLDRFVLQTHLNSLADHYCQDRVKQDRSYLKSIFDEAIEQEYLVKDPARKLKIPKNLPKDKRVLDWETLWAILATAARRDQLFLALDMTEALRPSELFALRWRSFDDQNTLKIAETVYRGSFAPTERLRAVWRRFTCLTALPSNSVPGRRNAGTYPPTISSSPTQMVVSCTLRTTATGS